MKLFLRIFSQIINKTYLLLATGLVLFAILVTLARALSPLLTHYNNDFTAWAETLLKRPVQIEKIKVSWRGLHPVIDLHNVSILEGSPGKVVFKLNDLQIGLNVFKSLFEHKIIVNSFFIKGVHVIVVQNHNNQWAIKGFSSNVVDENNGNKDFNEMISWLLSQPQLTLQKINVEIRTKQNKIRTITDLELMLSNEGDEHYLRGRAYLAKYQQSPIDIIIRSHGDVDDVAHLQGKFYLRANNFFVDSWLANKVFHGFKIKQGRFNARLWGEWQQQKIENLQAVLQFRKIILQQMSNDKKLMVDHLDANLFWQRLATAGWKLTGDKIRLVLNQQQWATTQFSLQALPSATGPSQQIMQVDFLQLNDLSLLFDYLTFLPKKFQQYWHSLAPTGELENIEFNHKGNLKSFHHYHIRSNLLNLHWQNYKKIPGVTGLDGSINFTEHNGQMKLASHHLNFAAQNIFRDTLNLQKLSTMVQWQEKSAGWSIQAQAINLASSEINLKGNMDFWLPKNKKRPHISLVASYTSTQLGKAKQYFPTKIMHKAVVKWLDHAFVKGKSATGSLILFGRLHHFPFVGNNGQFIVDSHIKGLQLNYFSGWPNAKNLSGNLIFYQHKMHFYLEHGNIAGQVIKHLTAVIPDMSAEPEAFLNISGQVAFANIAQGKTFVLQSPLRDTVGKNLLPLNMQGKGNLILKLHIPLKHGKVITDGKLTIQKNTLVIPSWKLKFNDINGQLHFTDNGISSPGLTAKFFNEPATVTIKTLHHNKKKITHFDIASKMQIAEVKKYFSLKEHGVFSGAAPFKAKLDIPVAGKIHLTVESLLQGVKINLPKPYDKLAQTPKQLRVDSYFTEHHPFSIKIAYQRLLTVLLGYTEKNNQVIFSRANIHLGAGDANLPQPPGIFITGHLNAFVWSEWRNILFPYAEQMQLSKNDKQANNVALKEINLQVTKLDVFNQHLTNANLLIVPKFDSWLFTINSQEIIGKATIPDDYKHKTTVGYFKRLKLQPINTGNKKTNDAWDPKEMLPVNLSAEDFSYGKQDYGKISLAAVPLTNGVRISQLEIKNPVYILKVNGRWLRINNKDSSDFSGMLSTTDLGTLLKQQNFTDHLYKGKGHANFKLAWPGNPTAFQNKNVRGTITAKFSDGVVTGLDEGTNQKIGLGKLINVLSLPSLASRLTLNFNDLKKKGYSFSEIRGDLKLQGNSVFAKALYLNGTVAEIYITGTLGISKQIYDLNVTVNPYVTSSLPILATIVGGPIAGAATWVISKVARFGVKKIVIYQYHIGGTWQDPIVKSRS